MNKKYVVTLTQEERTDLQKLISTGKAAARKLLHARILLKADGSPAGPCWSDAQISQALSVSPATRKPSAPTVCRTQLDGRLGAPLASRPTDAIAGWRGRSACSGTGLL